MFSGFRCRMSYLPFGLGQIQKDHPYFNFFSVRPIYTVRLRVRVNKVGNLIGCTPTPVVNTSSDLCLTATGCGWREIKGDGEGRFILFYRPFVLLPDGIGFRILRRPPTSIFGLPHTLKLLPPASLWNV